MLAYLPESLKLVALGLVLMGEIQAASCVVSLSVRFRRYIVTEVPFICPLTACMIRYHQYDTSGEHQGRRQGRPRGSPVQYYGFAGSLVYCTGDPRGRPGRLRGS